MKCPTCGETLDLMRGHECSLADNYVPEPARPDRAVFASTDWVEDAEAALAYLEKARQKAPDWKENYVADKELYLAEKCIRWAIESERMRSSTDPSSATAGQ